MLCSGVRTAAGRRTGPLCDCHLVFGTRTFRAVLLGSVMLGLVLLEADLL